MTALIDADSLLYKVCCAIEEKIIWNEPEFDAGIDKVAEITYSIDINQAYKTFDQLVENILFATGCDDCLLVFTTKGNFRDNLPIEYKANRKDLRKPEGMEKLLAYAKTNYTTKDHKDLEADDICVYLKTQYPDDYLLCAIDKDVLYQTVGTHYNYNSDEEVTVTEEEAINYAYYQTLVGDVSDGYKGCPGIGKVKAERALADCTNELEMWQMVVGLFEAKGLTKEDAINTMRLANMHQFNGKGVKLWEPPIDGV